MQIVNGIRGQWFRGLLDDSPAASARVCPRGMELRSGRSSLVHLGRRCTPRVAPRNVTQSHPRKRGMSGEQGGGARHDASREPRRPHRRRQPVWMDSSSGLPNHIPSSDVFYFIRSPVISAKAGELSFCLCWTGAAEGPARSGIRVGGGLLRSILSTASDPQALQ